MGILPLQFLPSQTAETLHLTGYEVFDITGLADVAREGFPRGKELAVKATRPDGSTAEFQVTVRIDTPQELVVTIGTGGFSSMLLRQLRHAAA